MCVLILLNVCPHTTICVRYVARWSVVSFYFMIVSCVFLSSMAASEEQAVGRMQRAAFIR
jgi:hypothetical protein